MGNNSLTIGWDESDQEKADDAQCSSTKTAGLIRLVSQTLILVSASRYVYCVHASACVVVCSCMWHVENRWNPMCLPFIQYVCCVLGVCACTVAGMQLPWCAICWSEGQLASLFSVPTM